MIFNLLRSCHCGLVHRRQCTAALRPLTQPLLCRGTVELAVHVPTSSTAEPGLGLDGSSEDTDSSAAEAHHLATEPEEDADTDAKPPAVLEANKPDSEPLKASQSKTIRQVFSTSR